MRHLSPPQVTDVESRAEQLVRRWRSRRNPYLALWVGRGTLLGIPLCGLLIFAAIMMVDRLQ